MVTPVSGANGWLTINNKPLIFQVGNENERINVIEYSYNTIRITENAPDTLAIIVEEEVLETARHGIWTWRPMYFAGIYEIVVATGTNETHSTWVRVFPHKFTQQLYEKMKGDLSTIAVDLLFRLDSPAMEKTKYTLREQDTSSLHDYKQIRSIIHEMRDIILHLQKDAIRTLQEERVQQDWQSIATLSYAAEPVPGERITLRAAVGRSGIKYLPQRWNVPNSNLTYDLYENRLLKQFLQKQLVAKLTIIEGRAESEKQRRAAIYARYGNSEDKKLIDKLKLVIADCQKMKQRCINWSSEPFLKNVQATAPLGKATQILLKHPTYSRFYRLYLRFQQRLMVTLDATSYTSELAMRRVSELYEMWSVFVISKMAIEELMAAGYKMVSNTTFYEVKKDYFQFDVRKNEASIILEKEDKRVEFKYEPIYPNLALTRNREALVADIFRNDPLTPDMAIEVYDHGRPQHVLIFDAKYRWDYDQPTGQYYPKQKDMNTMRGYRDNIQYQYDSGRTRDHYEIEKIVSSAYILYPGNQVYNEVSNRVGGMPLTPGMSPQRREKVREQLGELLYYAYLVN